jgi:outer membrane protein OmpA-like peptidoglycan-associated protein
MKETKKWLAGTLACVSLGLIASIFWMKSHSNSTGENISSSSEREVYLEQPKSQKPEKIEITVLREPYNYSLLRSESFQEKLAKVGISLNYENELDPLRRKQLLAGKRAALFVTTTDSVLTDNADGKIIAPISYSVGADVLFLNNRKCPIDSLKDLEKTSLSLKCKGIVYAKNSTSQYFLNFLLARFEEFNLSNLNPRPVSGSAAAFEVLRSPHNDVGAAILNQPQVEAALSEGYQIGISTRELPGAILNVLVANNALIEKHPDVLEKLLQIYYREIGQLQQQRSLITTEIVATDNELSPEKKQTLIDGTAFFTLSGAKNFLSNGEIEKQLGATAAILNLNGDLDSVPTVWQSYYNPHFLASVVAQNKKLNDLIEANESSKREKRKYFQTETDPTSTEIAPLTQLGTLDVREKIQFKSNSATIDSTSQKILARIAEQIKQFDRERISITIIGHTSSRGDVSFNQQLSANRAASVRKALVALGVTNEIVSIGKGSSQPLPGISPQANANQRTEITLASI